jgi:hypothetical protein
VGTKIKPFRHSNSAADERDARFHRVRIGE